MNYVKYILIAVAVVVLSVVVCACNGSKPAASSTRTTRDPSTTNEEPTTTTSATTVASSETPKDNQKVKLSFDSFDGGGPSYSVTVQDESIVKYEKWVEYADPDHDQMEGSAFDVYIEFTSVAPGTTRVIIEEYFPIMSTTTYTYYDATVADDLSLTLQKIDASDDDLFVKQNYDLVVTIGQYSYYMDVAKNPTSDAFEKNLRTNKLSLSMEDKDGAWKTGDLPEELPHDDKTHDAECGDIVLMEGRTLAICYKKTTGDFTVVGHISVPSERKLQDILGKGDVLVEFYLEWSE